MTCLPEVRPLGMMSQSMSRFNSVTRNALSRISSALFAHLFLFGTAFAAISVATSGIMFSEWI